MPITKSKALNANDRKFLELAIAEEKKVKKLLNKYKDEVGEAIAKYLVDGKITSQVKLNAAIDKASQTYFKDYTDVLVDYGKQVAAVQGKDAQSYSKTLTAAGQTELAQELAASAQFIPSVMANNMLNSKWAPDNKMLKVRIKTVQASAQKTIRNIIYNQQKRGKGAADIAKKIEQYIVPQQDMATTAPYDEFRKRYGRASNFVPKNVRSGSVQYNSLRIARTETAHMYRQSTLEYYKDKPYVMGFRWVISGSHGRQDDCDDYAANLYTDIGEVPSSHPNCLCRVLPVLLSEKELRNL